VSRFSRLGSQEGKQQVGGYLHAPKTDSDRVPYNNVHLSITWA